MEKTRVAWFLVTFVYEGQVITDILVNQDRNEGSGAVFSYLPFLVNLFILCKLKCLRLHTHVLTDYVDGEIVL